MPAGYGFSIADHKRVSRTVRAYEGGELGPGAKGPQPPRPRGVVRAMALDTLSFGLVGQIQGDFGLTEGFLPVIVTRPNLVFGAQGGIPEDGETTIQVPLVGNDYLIRCVVSGGSTGPDARTFQLNLIDPDGNNNVTDPIPEWADGSDVAEAINATGCPPVQVAGSESFGIDSQGAQFNFPARVWHVYWPNTFQSPNGWSMTTERPADEGDPPPLIYLPGPNEVAIELRQTCWQPTATVEKVAYPYQRACNPPIPGQFLLCTPLAGFGLAVIDTEYWQYSD